MRVPPSLTNSATTPSSRRLTSSMKAGGKDHSRPTNRPTFSVIRQLPSRSIVNPAIPDAQGMPDALAPEDVREVLVVPARRIVAPNSKDNVYVPQGIQPPRIVLVLDEVA